MAVVSYEATGDGGYVAHHDNGLIEYFDAAGNSLGYEYSGAIPTQQLTGMDAGNAVVVDDNGTPVKDRGGQYLVAPLPQGAQPTYYDPGGHPAYDAGLIPSYAPPPGGTAPATGGASGTPYTADSYDYGSGGYSGGYSRGYGGYRGGYSGGYGGGGGYNAFTSGGGEYGTVPRYANGQTHPFFGGAPLTPGGQFAQQSQGYDNRQQVRVPGGASAGPFETSAAPSPTGYGNNGAYGGGQAWNDQGRQGGGGGSSMGANSAIGQKMAAKVRGMAAKIQGGGSSSSSYGGDTKSYTRQQHRYNKGARQQQRSYEDGSYLYDGYKMRGFSKKMDPQQAEGFYYRPSMMIPKVAKGISKVTPRYDWLETLPANQLSTIAFGAKGKAKEGPSQYVNNLAKFYRDAAYRNDLPEYGKLVSNLQHAKKKSPLGSQFEQPLGFAADSYQGMVNAVLSTYKGDPDAAAARAKLASRYIDEYGSKFANKKPGKGKSINKWVGQRMDW